MAKEIKDEAVMTGNRNKRRKEKRRAARLVREEMKAEKKKREAKLPKAPKKLHCCDACGTNLSDKKGLDRHILICKPAYKKKKKNAKCRAERTKIRNDKESLRIIKEKGKTHA
jgi:hypothetical protein